MLAGPHEVQNSVLYSFFSINHAFQSLFYELFLKVIIYWVVHHNHKAVQSCVA